MPGGAHLLEVVRQWTRSGVFPGEVGLWESHASCPGPYTQRCSQLVSKFPWPHLNKASCPQPSLPSPLPLSLLLQAQILCKLWTLVSLP